MPPPTDDFTPDDFAADDFVADDFTPDTTTPAQVENRQAITDIERAQITNLRPTPESAAKWLADYTTLDNLIANSASIAGKVTAVDSFVEISA